MEQQTLIAVLVALGGVLAGAVLGGGTVAIVYGRGAALVARAIYDRLTIF